MNLVSCVKHLVKAPFRAIGLDIRRKRPHLLGFLKWFDIGTVLDVGAYEGWFSAEVRAVLPKVVIHAFEPLHGPFERMQQRYRHDKLFRAWNLAIGDETDTKEIQVNRMTATTSFLPLGEIKQYFPDAQIAKTEQVQMTTLDEWITEVRLTPNILLKADVQGYEGCVLRGANKTMPQVQIAVLEVSFVGLYEDQEMFDDINRQMREYGFRLHGMFGPVYDPKTHQQLQSNAIYFRSH